MGIIWRKFRYRFRRRKRKTNETKIRRFWRVFFVFLFVFSCCFGIYSLDARFKTPASKIVSSALHHDITAITNSAIKDTLEKENIDSRSLIFFEKDSSGAISSVSADYNAINRFKTALSLTLRESLEATDTIKASVPLGVLFSETLWSGIGPEIPIKALVSSAAEIEFTNDFTSEGINQTRYTLMAEVVVPTQVLGLVSSSELTVSVAVPIAETIIVGDVPTAYLNTK